jgi:hypothetical protein
MHSLVIRQRQDAANILECLFSIRVNLRKLIVEYCYHCTESTGLLANVVAFYPDLQVLSLEGSYPLTFAGYSLIPGLKKLSELNLTFSPVEYIYIKPLETHVCIHEHM